MESTEFADESQTSPKVAKGYKRVGMEGFIAKWYDKNARRTTQEQYKTWAKMVAENVAEGGSVLEVAPGPGYLAIELAKRGKYTIVGLDISRTFVEIAQNNATEAGVGAAVEFRRGDAAHMPFSDETFDFIISTAAFKNFADPIGALREMYRVLRVHGKAVIIDMRRDASDEAIREFVKNMGLSRIGSLTTNWTFRSLRRTAYTKNQFKDYISKTKFRRHDIRDSQDSIGFEIWLEK
ncbi:MAG: class I SAM-dependent methyltransferase [Halobacteriota archaeon]|jgi:ubiquinone/menaquinone biosynthesis C-methylase UbiE